MTYLMFANDLDKMSFQFILSFVVLSCDFFKFVILFDDLIELKIEFSQKIQSLVKVKITNQGRILPRALLAIR